MAKIKLSDIVKYSKGSQINGDDLIDDGEFIYLNGGINPSGRWNERNVEGNTITISEGGNSSGYINFIAEPFWCGAHCYFLYDLKYDAKYTYYALKSQQNRIMQLRSGACMPNIKKCSLNEFTLSIDADITKQNLVVATLDKVDKAIVLRKQQLEKLDELVKSRFIELFGKGNYPVVKAEDVCDFITKGTTPPTGEIYSDYSEDRVPYLKVYNLSFTGELLFDNEPQFISKDIHNGKLSRSKVYPKDVLMNIVGPPLGKFSLVSDEYEEWNINQAIAIFRAKEKIEPKFLLVALMQPTVLQPFLNQAVGIRQLNLSLEQCRNLEFPLPPIDEQNQFAAFVEQTDKSKLAIQQSLDDLETLKKALMQKYFG